MGKEEWYKAEGKGKNKEVTIKFKLNVRLLKYIGAILIILGLITIIILQHYAVIPTNGSVNRTVEDDEVENTTPVTVTTPDPEPEPTPEPEPEEPELLPITGEVFITIDKINIDPKPNIDDYAKITSVEFTIRNQDIDFEPKVVVYLTDYEG